MYRHFSLTKLSLAMVVAVGLVALGIASIPSPALADHEAGHDEIARGKIGALAEKIWNCENKIAPCERIGLQGPNGVDGAPGADSPLNALVCEQGATVIYDQTLGWVCN